MTDPILEVRDLEISFFSGKKRTPRTDGVRFSLYPGEILCLVGESGCGKSVTALSILGLLGDAGRITGGEILFDGQDLVRLPEKELDRVRGNEISMIFQDIMYSMNPVFRIGDQLTEGMRKHLHMARPEAEKRAVELLRKTGIREPEKAMRAYPHQLSGGMRQRAMIAMAVACRPRILIADEPTTALDATIQLQIMALLRRLRDEENTAVLLITHDIGVVAEMADRVMVMYAGQCVEDGTAESVLTAPRHPYTRALMRAVPTLNMDRSERLYSIPGQVPEDYHALSGCRFRDRCPNGQRCAGKPVWLDLGDGHRAYCAPDLADGRDQDG